MDWVSASAAVARRTWASSPQGWVHGVPQKQKPNLCPESHLPISEKLQYKSPKFALDYWETKRLGCCCPKTVNELQFISLWADTEANRRIVMEKVGMLRFLSLLVLGGFITGAVNAQELLGF